MAKKRKERGEPSTESLVEEPILEDPIPEEEPILEDPTPVEESKPDSSSGSGYKKPARKIPAPPRPTEEIPVSNTSGEGSRRTSGQHTVYEGLPGRAGRTKQFLAGKRVI